MKKLLKMYKSLPREVRMMLAMAGMGTPVGAIYLLKRFLFPGVKMIYLIFGVAVVIGVIALIALLLSRVFGFGGRKRQKKMEADMAGGSESGPSGMEVRARISVYDLPWYIIIGDSGCGKTKLINEGGLVFSRGKPEGYQLGTLDYNFWFTEDAVFVDMAGRLCNPQEDSDRREWTSFLETIANGRKGFPINGTIVCVSAEHLLEDSPEKIEQDANTVLERLRDLQSKLGVTFATYLVITKCDKVLGFMQLFDRASHDVTLKKQIFGWSKPTSFDELYNPDDFDEDFDSIYERLSDLRLRRLNDDVDEVERGLAYCFPEEFRTLRQPLNTYVRTLFPMVKNPKAMKNLIFRGVYFTSATQEGGVILKHLSERLGEETASQFAPLESLYPQPTPHFVRDLLFKKVFPEYGLVFRNEAQVARNRRLAKIAKIGSAALSLVLISTLVWTSLSFGDLIGGASADSAKLIHATDDGKREAVLPASALADSVRLGQHVQTLEAHPVARTILSGGIGADQPIHDLSLLEAQLFETGPLSSALRDIDEALRTAVRSTDEEQTRYREALREYVAWFGCSAQRQPSDAVAYEGFRERLCAVVAKEESVIRNENREAFFKEAERYFAIVANLDGAKNPARLLRPAGKLEAVETIEIAVANAHEDLGTYALLKSSHPDPRIAEWMRIAENCAAAHAAYAAMLGTTAPDAINTVAELTTFQQTFSTQFAAFSKALDGCAWQSGKDTKRVRIPSIAEAIKDTRKHWTSYEKALRDTYAHCETRPDDDEAVTKVITWISAGNPNPGGVLGLDHVLFESLKKEAQLLPPETEYGPDYFDDILEVYKRYAHTIELKKAEDVGGSDAVLLKGAANGVRTALGQINEGLAGAADLSADVPVTRWPTELMKYQRLPENKTDPSMQKLVAELDPAWLPDKLQALMGSYKVLAHRGRATGLLQSMEKQLTRATGQRNRWGLAELAADWQKPQPSAYVIATEAGAAETPDTPEPPTRVTPSDNPFDNPFGSTTPKAETPIRPAVPVPSAGGTEDIPTCATAPFLMQRGDECLQTLYWLDATRPTLYFTTAGADAQLHQRCRDKLRSSWQRYCEAYIAAWDQAYAQKKIGALENLSNHKTWDTFADQFGQRDRAGKNIEDVRRELIPALRQILRNVRWGLFGHQNKGWMGAYGDAVSEQRKFIYDTYDAAMGTYWKQGGFIRGAIHAGTLEPDAQPWSDVSSAFDKNWADLAGAIGRNAKLRDKFERKPRPNETAPIPWPDIDALRGSRDLPLGDEKLTGQLASFVEVGRRLLDARLTGILAAIENRHLPETATPYDGWPYINGAGTGEHAMDTVPYAGYIAFLTEVDFARSFLEPLEKDLPTGAAKLAGQTRRESFHEQCQAWRAFMRIGEQGRNTLEVTITGRDPVGEEVDQAGEHGAHDIQDTPQHFYNEAALNLGLITSDGDEDALTIASQTDRRRDEGPRKVQWKWQAAGSRNLWFNLLRPVPGVNNEPFPNLQPQSLGTSSPLALPAYLHRYGRFHAGSGGYWITAHAVELNKVIDASQIPAKAKAQTKVGMKFKFELDRAMPAPIRAIGR
jgi:hypothetical protein